LRFRGSTTIPGMSQISRIPGVALAILTA
jgi:hypothetical protein